MPETTPYMAAGNGAGKVRLLTRDQVDGRTRARRRFDEIAEGVVSDLGGPSQITTIQRSLIEAFAGTILLVEDASARLLLGDAIDLTMFGALSSTLVRLASRIGVNRVPREIAPTLEQYLSPDTEPQVEEEVSR